MPDAIAAMKDAFTALSSGEIDAPLRQHLALDDAGRAVMSMPCHAPGKERVSLKFLSIVPDNPAAGRPMIQALVTLMDARSGAPLAVIDGATLTSLRTGAASGAATDLLARRDARSAGIFGAGAQGRTQLRAVHAVRPIEKATVFDLDAACAAEFAASMSAELAIEVRAASSSAEAAAADVVCTATGACAPVLADSDVREGAHINAIGAYKPSMCEIPVETVRRARVVVDEREAAEEEAGDLIPLISSGELSLSATVELGELARDPSLGRQSPTEVTLFKSVGHGVQDLFAAARAVEQALAQDLGVKVEL